LRSVRWGFRGKYDPAPHLTAFFRFEMLQPNRSFWSFYTLDKVERGDLNTPTTFVETMYDLTININTAQSHTPITVVWDTNLPLYDSTRVLQDESHLVAFSEFYSSPSEYGSLTTRHTDTRPWVGTDDLICHVVPGMVFFVISFHRNSAILLAASSSTRADLRLVNHTLLHGVSLHTLGFYWSPTVGDSGMGLLMNLLSRKDSFQLFSTRAFRAPL
jgi:hypothetical protein